jgi:glycerophosphoryl diester phosphodiesterase
VVFHDDTLDRLTHTTGPVAKRTARELADLVLVGSDERIPTLVDILELVDGQVPILIELKDQSGAIGEGEDQLERAVAEDLRGYAGPVAVMSFNPHVVAAMRTHAPDVPRGLVSSAFIPSQWPQISAETCTHLRSIFRFRPRGRQLHQP